MPEKNTFPIQQGFTLSFLIFSHTQVWVEKAEKGRLLGGDELNLADLFHPNTFLNAVRQQTARDGKTSMDELKLVASWNGNISNASLKVKVSVGW